MNATTPHPIPRGAPISRRELLQTAALLALPGSGCASFSNNVRLAMVAGGGLDRGELAQILRALIAAVLAYDHAEFAAGTQTQVADCVLSFFPIDRDPQLKPLATALAIFDRMELFTALPPPMRTAERKLLASEGVVGAAADAVLAEREAADLRAFHALRPQPGGARFSSAEISLARGYLALWGHSEFLMRRRIYRAVRSMILVAAYSLPAHWPAIGYDGPLLDRSGSRGS